MKFKPLIVGAVMTAFSLLALAVPKAADKPATKIKSAKKAEQGKTRGLKSKKGKECVGDNGCESGN